MKSMRTLVLATCISCLGAFLTPKADADDWDQKSVLTFDQSVELPGVVLPAGTYVFKLLKSPSDRNHVRVLSRDERTVYATIKTIPNYRSKPSERTLIVFEDRQTGEPRAIKGWFYRNRKYGHEFVYPKKEPVSLAKAESSGTNDQHVNEQLAAAPVITEPETALEQISDESDHAMNYLAPITQSEMTDYFQLPEQKQEEPLLMAKSEIPENTTETLEMPHTAGYLPLVGLSGILLLGAGAGIRFYSRMRAE